jgi:hypothetical protein
MVDGNSIDLKLLTLYTRIDLLQNLQFELLIL